MAASHHLLNLMGAFATAVHDDIRQALEADVGAGGGVPAAIVALDTWPDRSVDFLSRVLGLTHPGAVRLAERLAADRLLERRTGADRRTAALRLTARGRAVARRARASRYRVLAGFARNLTPADRRALEAILDRALRRGRRVRVQAQRACRFCDHSVCRGNACPIGASAGPS
jgi:DNA-binding MarR family transcriptional regulator